MDILIEQNTRGTLEIKQKAFNKLLKMMILNNSPSAIKDVEVVSESYVDRYFSILVKLMISPKAQSFQFDEKKIIQQIEMIVMQTLAVKPKNIAIAYQWK